MLMRTRANKQEEERQHNVPPASAFPVWYSSAKSVLCVHIVASSVGSAAIMPGLQQVHQLTILRLLRVTGHLNSLSMASGLRAHLHRHHLHGDRLRMLGKQIFVWRT